MQYLESIFKALGDRSRLSVMAALEDGELCVCQITEMLGFAQPTVSRHMRVLQQAGLVKSKKKQRWVFYRLADEDSSKEVEKILELLKKVFREDQQFDQIKKQIAEIKSRNPELLCTPGKKG